MWNTTASFWRGVLQGQFMAEGRTEEHYRRTLEIATLHACGISFFGPAPRCAALREPMLCQQATEELRQMATLFCAGAGGGLVLFLRIRQIMCIETWHEYSSLWNEGA